MDFIRQTIKRNNQKGKGYSQITLEDDYIVPDVKPDMARIIHTQGKIQIDESKIANQSLWISGRLNFVVLYRSEDENKKLEAVVGSIPFQEKILMDDLEDGDSIRVKGQVEDISSSMINSRKMGIRAVINLEAVAENAEDMEMTLGMEQGRDYEQRFSRKNLMVMTENRKDLLRIRKESDIPGSKPNMDEVIFTSADIRNLEQNSTNDGIMVQGEVYICVIYRCREDEQAICYETMIPFNGKVESEGMDPKDIYWLDLTPTSVEVEAREDYDGEPRTIGMELTFDVQLRVWKEQEMEILEDFYSLERQVIPEKENVWLEELLVKNQAKLRLGDTFKLENSKEKMLQICCYRGDVTLENVKKENGGLFVEGFMKIHILYLTSDEYMPMGHHEAFLPIEQLIEVPDSENMGWYDLQTDVQQLQVNLLDGMEYEVKATVNISVIAFQDIRVEKILTAEEVPLDMEVIQNQPGFVGYVVQENESLWDIAKNYHTTVEHIMKTNNLREEELPRGSKIMIVKEIAS